MRNMRKRTGSNFTGLALVVLTAFLAAEGAEAFCIYNKTAGKIKVTQAEGHKAGRGFKKEINAGDSACCHWSNKDCNKKGKKDSALLFNVEKAGYTYTDKDEICVAAIKAGGWLTVKGTDGNYICEAHY
jgi:hypothetical protein